MGWWGVVKVYHKTPWGKSSPVLLALQQKTTCRLVYSLQLRHPHSIIARYCTVILLAKVLCPVELNVYDGFFRSNGRLLSWIFVQLLPMFICSEDKVNILKCSQTQFDVCWHLDLIEVIPSIAYRPIINIGKKNGAKTYFIHLTTLFTWIDKSI